MVNKDVIPNTNNETIKSVILSLNNSSLKGIKGNRKFAWLIEKEFKEYTHIYETETKYDLYEFYNFVTIDGLKCYYYVAKHNGVKYRFITDHMFWD